MAFWMSGALSVGGESGIVQRCGRKRRRDSKERGDVRCAGQVNSR